MDRKVSIPEIMNSFVNEAFDDEDNENNNNEDDVFDETRLTTLAIPGVKEIGRPGQGRERKVSQICAKAATQNRRKQNLVEIRECILAISHLNTINQAQLQTLLSDRNFCLIFFRLFDEKSSGVLDQSVWFGKLKYWYQVA